MLIGYARVSTQNQNLDLQREALLKAGCQKVFEDNVSGTRADRPGLAKAQEMLRERDTLVVWKLEMWPEILTSPFQPCIAGCPLRRTPNLGF